MRARAEIAWGPRPPVRGSWPHPGTLILLDRSIFAALLASVLLAFSLLVIRPPVSASTTYGAERVSVIVREAKGDTAQVERAIVAFGAGWADTWASSTASPLTFRGRP